MSRPLGVCLGAAALLLGAAGVVPSAAQTTTCEPVANRGDRVLGCFITARQELGALPRDSALYWHLTTYPTLAAAQVAAATLPRSTAVTSLGKHWLFTLAGGRFRPPGGRLIARVGPLPLVDAAAFAAVYMEGVFEPGMRTAVHRHPGPEAWYTLQGEQCLETPEGRQVQRAGEPGMMVRGGLPMQLTGTGTGRRRSVVLILQDAAQPRSTPANDWSPKGLC
ncbi:MAG: cupin domain-containing protein [Gemmatimonadales bacterium]